MTLTFDQNGATSGVLHIFHKRVLLIAQRLLVDLARPSQHVLAQVLDRIDGETATGQCQTLHVAALGTTQGQDSFLCEEVKGEGIDAFLVDDDERFAVLAHLEKWKNRICWFRLIFC